MTREEYITQIAKFELSVTSNDILIMTEEHQLVLWTPHGAILFKLNDSNDFADQRPEVFPIHRIKKVTYEKRLLGADRFCFEVDGRDYELSLPHRTKQLTTQREELKKIREQFMNQ